MLLPLFLPIFLTYTTTVSTPTDEYNLKAVHVVFRHGDSVLEKPQFYPNDPDTPHDYDPHVPGDLTNAGKMRSYKLGQFLRSRYSDLLGEEYRRSDVYARSTYLERSRASLLLVLAGLYPPKATQRWHPTLDWQPISIESPKYGTDDPLMWSIGCSAYLEERALVESSDEFTAAVGSLTEFLVEISNVTSLGPEISEAVIADLYHKLRAGIDSQVSIPDWTDVYISPTIARNAAILRYHTQNYNNRLRRLNGGMLLRKIFDDMTAVAEGKKMPKINLYGGQEFNVVALLWALDTWKPIVPKYASAAIVEFWQKNSRYYVKVLYHDGLTGETEARTIEGCSKMCSFEDFRMLRHEVLPVDFSECYSEYDKDSRKQCLKDEKESNRIRM